MDQTEWRVGSISGGIMSQLALLPIDGQDAADAQPSSRLVRMPRRPGRAPRIAVGAPGFLSVRAAAERLGMQPRSVRALIERQRLSSQRLGRIHFISQAQVEKYRRVRRERARARRVRQSSLG
jgi:excisionase family DNA binding protein